MVPLNAKKRPFLVGYFFARFVCPALSLPDMALDLEMDGGTLKVSVMISKILLAGASGRMFESSLMQFANEFLNDEKVHFFSFIISNQIFIFFFSFHFR